MTIPQVVPASEWLAARKELLAAEARAVDALAEATACRRALPALRVDKDYVFAGAGGQASLLDLFEGRRQLIVQHFMFDRPGTKAAPTALTRRTASGSWPTCTPATRPSPWCHAPRSARSRHSGGAWTGRSRGTPRWAATSSKHTLTVQARCRLVRRVCHYIINGRPGRVVGSAQEAMWP
jgi:hypothetical protein